MQKMMEQSANLDQQGTSARVDQDGNKVSRSEMNKKNSDALKEARKRLAEKYGDSYDDENEE